MQRRLTGANQCSAFVLMEVETLGMARSLGWKVHMRCAGGYRESTRSMRRCVYRPDAQDAPTPVFDHPSSPAYSYAKHLN